MSARITFCGGAGTVTGANFLLDTGDKKLLVDCGALERERVCDPENLKAFSYDPASVDALFVTHAHQDHIGRVPKLVRDGFRGAIFSTPATKELSALMFEDALSVMQNEKERYGCDFLYERPDVERALSLWKTHEYHESFAVGDAQVGFLDAGHILGSAMVKFERGGRTILFTGDIGNSPEPLLHDVESAAGANYLVMESVYGDRSHEDRAARREILKSAVEETREKKGTLLIPSFSIERTQVLLFELKEMMEKKEVPLTPVYLDAPLAIRITEVFEKYKNELNAAAAAEGRAGRPLFSFPELLETPRVSESREIHAMPDPKVIIAGAGMSSGGRVRAHEKRYLSEKNSVILLVGYQAPGSLGRRIQDGQHNVVIDGKNIQVRARVISLTGYSGHADKDQLLAFAESAGDSLEEAFVVMGEPRASGFLAQRIKDFLGVEALVPALGDSISINW
ncbi:MAG TPA: MBL fold metallo-hydrolase [Candidatus Paceibacterota bacterium]|nr:MBL fold metallo-hydrolase [Candidatus Paceibacterota bacterium]